MCLLYQCNNVNVHIQKISILPHRRDWNFLGEVYWNFQIWEGGGGALRKNPFHWRGMDIFWNYTIRIWQFYLMCAAHSLRLQLHSLWSAFWVTQFVICYNHSLVFYQAL